MSDLQTYIRERVVIEENGCWIWQMALDRDGYGYGCFSQRRRKAHRLSHEGFKGPIPAGMQIDHLCRVRNCVNPDHLEAVTCGENIRRGLTGGQTKAHCKRGHSFAAHGFRRKNGSKMCRLCERVRAREGYAKKREAICERRREFYQNNRERVLARMAFKRHEMKEA